MKRKIAMVWAEALESGEYGQTKGTLRNKHNNFCCLSVLCNLHAQANPKFAAYEKEKLSYGGGTGLPPAVVTDWAGMNYDDGSIKYNGYKTSKGEFTDLAEANDAGVKFPEIAQLIRKHYKEL